MNCIVFSSPLIEKEMKARGKYQRYIKCKSLEEKVVRITKVNVVENANIWISK
jgi:hypothetical protein